MIPQQTPVNQKQKQKLAPYKMHAPSLFPGPKPNHLISLCLIEWLVWKYVLLVHVQLSPGNPAIFFQKTRFLQNGMVDQKKILTKCLRLLQKCPWNGTWVKPFHSGNIQRDAKGPKQSGISHSALLNYQRGTDSAWTPNTPGTSGW